MKLRRGSSDDDAVRDFWGWWTEFGVHQVSGPAFAGDPAAATAELASRLAVLHPALGWSLSGTPGERRLVLSTGNDPLAVILVERMRRSAPEIDGWTVQVGRGPDADAAVATVSVAGYRVDLGAVEITAEPDAFRARINVSAYHPDFRVFPLPVSQEIALHKLDFELGEGAVGRWVGSIDIATIRPVASASSDALRHAIREVSAPPSDEWSVAGGQWGNGQPFTAQIRRTLRWQDHPFLTQQHLLTARYRRLPNGLPTDEEFERLGGIDEALESLREPAQLVMLLHSGGVRQILLYAREDDVESAQALRLIAKQNGYKHRTRPDPGWSTAAPFL